MAAFLYKKPRIASTRHYACLWPSLLFHVEHSGKILQQGTLTLLTYPPRKMLTGPKNEENIVNTSANRTNYTSKALMQGAVNAIDRLGTQRIVTKEHWRGKNMSDTD